MKIVLANVWKIKNTTPHFGLTSLAAFLRQELPNIEIKIIEGFQPLPEILKSQPDLVGFTSDTLTFQDTKKTAQKIKKKLKIPILIGGVHITALPKNFSYPFDIGIIGEGEITLTQLLKSYLKNKKFITSELHQINGLVFKNHNKLIQTPPRELIENIDLLPFPARDITPMEEVYLKNQINLFGVKKMISIMTSRGCPYHCIFCGSPVQWKRVRFHSPEYVINEIKFLVKTYKIDGIMFWDDLFMAPLDRLKKLKQLIIKNKLHQKLTFFGYGRANLMTQDVCQTLAQMNVKRLIFGLESGSPKILNYLKQNSVTVEDNQRAIDLCHRYHITSSSGYIVGTPGETIQDLQQTFDLMKKHPLDNTQIYILTPYPGTKIWQYAKQQKIVTDRINFNKLFVQLPPINFFDLFKSKKNLIKNRIFLNTKYQKNKTYLNLIFKIQKLAFIQNSIFYFKIIPQNLKLIIRIILNQFNGSKNSH